MDERSILHSSGLLGKKPLIGLIMVVIGSLIFILFAYNLVYQGQLTKWDLSVTEKVHTLALNSPAWVTSIMIAGFWIGGQWGIIILGVVLGLYFIYKRFWREFVMVAVGFAGGGLLFLLLSGIFNRARPVFDKLVWTGTPHIPGFPSGHTLTIIVCVGFLAYLLVPRIKSYLGKTLIIALALLLVVYIGFARLYVGDHYMTDILAGYAAGIVWFGLAYTSIECIAQKYNSRK